MHPAWAGAGGNWPAIDEVFDPQVVRQKDDFSCVAACGEMLLKERGIVVSQIQISAEAGSPTTLGKIAVVMNKFDADISHQWLGGNLVLPGASEIQIFDVLNETGSWGAMLWQPGAGMGHLVVVDGKDSLGYALIRDPWQGTKYKMTVKDFLLYWNEHGVFQRKL